MTTMTSQSIIGLKYRAHKYPQVSRPSMYGLNRASDCVEIPKGKNLDLGDTVLKNRGHIRLDCAQ
jgi:hypothetical protein